MATGPLVSQFILQQGLAGQNALAQGPPAGAKPNSPLSLLAYASIFLGRGGDQWVERTLFCLSLGAPEGCLTGGPHRVAESQILGSGLGCLNRQLVLLGWMGSKEQ